MVWVAARVAEHALVLAKGDGESASEIDDAASGGELVVVEFEVEIAELGVGGAESGDRDVGRGL